MQPSGLRLKMDPKEHMEKLGHTWRYSNMSPVLMREERSTGLQFEGTLDFSAEQWLPGSGVAAGEGSFISRSQGSEGISKELQTPQRNVAPTPHTTCTSLLCLEDMAECETETFHDTRAISYPRSGATGKLPRLKGDVETQCELKMGHEFSVIR